MSTHVEFCELEYIVDTGISNSYYLFLSPRFLSIALKYLPYSGRTGLTRNLFYRLPLKMWIFFAAEIQQINK